MSTVRHTYIHILLTVRHTLIHILTTDKHTHIYINIESHTSSENIYKYIDMLSTFRNTYIL